MTKYPWDMTRAENSLRGIRARNDLRLHIAEALREQQFDAADLLREELSQMERLDPYLGARNS